MAELLKPGHRVLVALAKALGLEGRHVRRIVLDVSVDAIPKLTVERYAGESVTSDEFVSAAEELRPSLEVTEVTAAAGGGSGGF